jgi:hypothetical protein
MNERVSMFIKKGLKNSGFWRYCIQYQNDTNSGVTAKAFDEAA